ncbi:MAG TPA: hypothetical protein VFH58_10390 [Acidimicrobiales bacterium]|nr:hypothetical protein [Acidimicrobiales bacterium]
MAAGFIAAAVVAGILLVPGLVIVIAAGVSAGRGDPDDSGRRGRAVYLGTTSFVALFVALFASFGIVVSLTMLIGPDNSAPSAFSSGSPGQVFSSSAGGNAGRFTVGGNPPETLTTTASGTVVPGMGSGMLRAVPLTGGGPRNNQVISAALGAGLIGLAAGVVLFLHLPRLWAMLGEEDSRRSGTGRTLATYLHATSFLSVFIAALAAASALYGVYRLVAPGVALTSGHSEGLRQLIDSAYLAVAAGVIFMTHRRAATAGETGPPAPDGGPGSITPPSTPPG